MATDTEQLILSISADISQVKRSLKRLEGDAKQAGRGIEKALSFSNDNASRSMRAMQADAKNLTFQLNDIAVGLAGGQSPFTIMMQQGSQVTQVLSGAGGVKNALTALGAAFGGLLSPIGLVSSALILGVGYAVQYFTAAEEGSDKANKALKAHADALKQIGDTYGDLVPGAKELLAAYSEKIELTESLATLRTEIEKTNQANLDNLKRSLAGTDDEAGDLNNAIAAFAATFDDLRQAQAAINPIRRALHDVREELEANRDPTEQFLKFIELLEATGDAGLKALAESLKPFTKNLQQSSKEMKILIDLEKKLGEADAGTAAKLKEHNKALEEMGKIGQPQLTDMQKLMIAYGEAVRSATTDQAKLNALLALMAGIGRLEAGEILGDIKSAADLIRKEEGFRPGAYWDTNAFRVGFGSDTFVDEMGKVQKVTKDTVVTVAQAEADLTRRIGEFQATIRSQIGGETWAALEENQQAALTSIAYNYGSLPASIVKAIQAGDHGQVALAIRNLSANPERRQREAQLYATGSAPAGDALKAADDAKTLAEKRAEANEKLKEMITTEQQKIALDEKINEINRDRTATEDEKALAIARVTAEAAKEAEVEKLLAQAKEAGKTIDAELIAQYNALAQAKVNAIVQDKEIAIANRLAADSEKQRVDALKQLNQQAQQMVSGAITGFIQDLRNGVDAGEAFNNMLNRIIDSLIQMAVQMAVKSLFGGGGGLGSLFGVAHSGGIVGQTAFPRRNVDPRVFIGAPRMASGGLVGGEVPIIAHRGEMVIPKSMVGRGGTAPGNNTYNFNDRIKIDMSQTGLVSGSSEDAKQFGINVQKLIQLEMVRESRPGGLLRKVPV